ncbi:MAG TPA: DUF971 domain-containing protein [Pseudomonadaceae bacterium]|nr:DUF971 domain-containing protein [Pseudomonadaceae bacterium]
MQPSDIRLHKKSATLELGYSDNSRFILDAEFLRVYSPSAEVRGHGQGQEVLQVGKRQVKISKVEPVGNYAVRLHFDDDHNTGIYSWDYLYELARGHEQLWQDYLQRLQAAGASRDALPSGVQVVNIMPLKN